MKFKKTRDDTVFIAWCGYPNCKHTMRSANGIKNLKMLNKNWPNWMKNRKENVKMFKINFHAEYINVKHHDYLPNSNHTSGEFWVYDNWDKAYIFLVNEFRNCQK